LLKKSEKVLFHTYERATKEKTIYLVARSNLWLLTKCWKNISSILLNWASSRSSRIAETGEKSDDSILHKR
jgi:hypothetical protein